MIYCQSRSWDKLHFLPKYKNKTFQENIFRNGVCKKLPIDILCTKQQYVKKENEKHKGHRSLHHVIQCLLNLYYKIRSEALDKNILLDWDLGQNILEKYQSLWPHKFFHML